VSDDPQLDTASIRSAASVLGTRERVHVLFEGRREDCLEQARRHGLVEGEEPRLPEGARLSVPPSCVPEALSRLDGKYVAELGVGIIHANPAADRLPGLRAFCESVGGRLLVLQADSGTAAFGSGARGELQRRVREAFDPEGVFAPWRFAA
jgi:hypothetical protein